MFYRVVVGKLQLPRQEFPAKPDQKKKSYFVKAPSIENGDVFEEGRLDSKTIHNLLKSGIIAIEAEEPKAKKPGRPPKKAEELE